MSKQSTLIFGLALAVAAPLASASTDAPRVHPTVGGAEQTYAEAGRGINAPTNTNEFWYAGTGGWPSE